MLLAKSTPLSHGNPPPPRKLYHMANVSPEGIPYGKPSPGRNPMAELPQGGNNVIWSSFPSMVNLPHTNFMIREHIPH